MENKYFSLNGLLGFLMTVILLLIIVAFLTYMAINIQKKEATNYYSIDSMDVNMIDKTNKDKYHLNGVK